MVIVKISTQNTIFFGAWFETKGPRVQASPLSLSCVLEQDTLILANYWFNPSLHNWKIVDGT